MHIKVSIFLLLYLASPVLTGKLFAQNIHPAQVTLPGQLLKFIPKGYALLDTAMGDLDLDKVPDVILVLKAIEEDAAKDATKYKRPLLILLRHPGNSYSLAARNDNVVYCLHCGGIYGDPYSGLEIKKGSFTIHHYGGSNERWTHEITFTYLKTTKTWNLFKIIDESWNVFHSNKVRTIVKTKKDFGIVSFGKYENNY